jgi:hypothetical protein
MSRPKKLTEEEKKLIKREISRRLREAKGTDFTPYTNRDGSESWQQKLEKLICEKDTNEIWAVLANGSGKTAYGAYLICSILHGTHHVKEKVFEGKPLHLHIICEDTDVQRLTIQKYMEEQTDYMLTGYAPVTNKDFFVRRNAGIFKEIVNVKTKDKVTFSTAAEGATGLVGVQPDILFSDEPIAQEVYNELVARNRGANARFIMACTAISSKHGWVIEKARDIRDGRLKAKGVHLLSSRTIDNPHVGLEKVEYWKEIYGEDSHEYRVRALGDLILLEGLVFPGIHNCIVPNDYVPAPYKRVVEMGGTPYRWYEAADFGFSDTDPTLVLYAKQYDNGEVVIEDEICIYNGTTQEWCDAIIKKRHELGMPYRNSINILDPELGIPICKPYKSVGDAKYLQRRSRDTGSSLRSDLVARKIFMSESLKEKVEYRLPAVQNAIRFKTLLFKEKCHESLHFIQMHTYKRKADGTQSPDNSLYDHCADCLRYLFQTIRGVGKMQEAISETRKENIQKNRRGNKI